jgi:hypothetical protein
VPAANKYDNRAKPASALPIGLRSPENNLIYQAPPIAANPHEETSMSVRSIL